MSHSTQFDKKRIATSAPESEAGVLVVRRHHLLVRCSHWLNVPILLSLILSGLSIYWASPVYQHKPDPLTGNVDPLADIGIWICAHLPGLHQYSSPPDWCRRQRAKRTSCFGHWGVERVHVGSRTGFRCFQMMVETRSCRSYALAGQCSENFTDRHRHDCPYSSRGTVT